MKNVRLIVGFVLLVMCSNSIAFDAFCDGYEEGFKAGACYQKFSCLPPLTPLCPLPKLGEDGYQDGYNRGFLDGLHHR